MASTSFFASSLHYLIPAHSSRILVLVGIVRSIEECNNIWSHWSIFCKKCKVHKEDILSHPRICYNKELEHGDMPGYDTLCRA